MLAYMIFVGETGGGDSRKITSIEDNISRLIFFGGLGYVIYRLNYNKKLLRNQKLMILQRLKENDERKQFSHAKSGGIVVDILLIALLFTVCTSALLHLPAFGTALAILIFTIMLKVFAYFIYNKLI